MDPPPFIHQNLDEQQQAARHHGRMRLLFQVILNHIDDDVPERATLEDLRLQDHAMGIQASLTYALNLAVALDTGYRIPGAHGQPSGSYRRVHRTRGRSRYGLLRYSTR
jgi:hypothetical protein